VYLYQIHTQKCKIQNNSRKSNYYLLIINFNLIQGLVVAVIVDDVAVVDCCCIAIAVVKQVNCRIL
jgi:hypothetical protein